MMWTGQGKKIPVIIFGASAITGKDPKSKEIGGIVCLYSFAVYKFHKKLNAEKYLCSLVYQLLRALPHDVQSW